MNESFLHFVWQFQYFDKQDLQTQETEPLSIFNVGFLNTNAGSDFSQAKIQIDKIEWVGNVEIHIKSSDWLLHKHDQNKSYDNVILHVVWQNDRKIKRTDGTFIPTLELKNRISKDLLKRYAQLVNSSDSIPCGKVFDKVDSILKTSMLDKAILQRLETKSGEILKMVGYNKGNWEETTYQWLAKSFGFKINSEPFLQLAKSLPYKIIQKHSSSISQIEALLFGQAGMLPAKTKDEYVTALFAEYQFLSQKYSLRETALHFSQWKFLRLRPANFPTLRIAQFARLMFTNPTLFSKIKEAKSSIELIRLIDATPSAYWQTHYHFAKKSKSKIAPLGTSSKENLLINSMAPLLAAYGKYSDDYTYIDKATEMLQYLPAEKNKITRCWEELGLTVKSSFDSQALIEQYNNMCQKRFCLNCVVGTSILKPR